MCYKSVVRVCKFLSWLQSVSQSIAWRSSFLLHRPLGKASIGKIVKLWQKLEKNALFPLIKTTSTFKTKLKLYLIQFFASSGQRTIEGSQVWSTSHLIVVHGNVIRPQWSIFWSLLTFIFWSYLSLKGHIHYFIFILWFAKKYFLSTTWKSLGNLESY